MKLLAGTSGYAFKEWKGSFYPEDLKDDGMLGFYAGKFPTVEINNTFYRLPKEHVLKEWASRVPETFTFAIKASQRITHHARLKPECAGPLEFLLKNDRGARQPARPDPVSTAAEPEKGCAASPGLSGDAAAGPEVHDRVSEQHAGSMTRSSTRCARATSRCV